MQSWMIAFSVGIVAAGFTPFVPPAPWLAALCLSALLLHALPLLRMPAAVLAGACWFLCWAHGTLEALWPAAQAGEDRWVQGVVWSVPEPNAQGGWRFRLRLESLCVLPGEAACAAWQKEDRPRLALISVYEPMTLQPGQRWQFLLRLQPPHGAANPGGFAYDTWLIQQGIRATGYVRAPQSSRLLAVADGRPWFNRLRWYLGGLMDRADGGLWLQAPLLKALALGDKSGITDTQWTLFTALGLNHLMVISGLHIGLVCAVSYRLALLLAKWFSRCCLAPGAPRIAVLFSALAAFVYAGLAGFSLPALRALIMALVCLAAIGLQRQSAGRNVLVLALLLVLAGDPLAPQTAGFWLSFLAVAVLMTQTGKPGGTPARRVVLLLGVQALLFVGMLPVMGLFFQQGSLAAPLVNLAAIPWIGLLVVPLTLAGLLLLPLWFTAGRWMLNLSDWFLQAFMEALLWTHAQLPASLMPVPQSALMLLLLSLCALGCLLGKRPLLRFGSLAAMVLLLAVPRGGRPSGNLQIIVLDVGQGLAVIIDTGSQRVLYDSGPRFSESFDAGSDVILPALGKLGLTAPDVIIISHGDSDHAGGLSALEQAFPQALYLAPDTSLFSAGLQTASCAGQQWSSAGTTFQILHPDQGSYSSNNASCVLQLRVGETRVLLPGDIEREVELALLERFPDLQAELLIAPHHGSNTSSTWPFVKHLRPELVVFSSGYLSRFGHPTAAVQYRYRVLGAQPFNTARSGALRFVIDASGGLSRMQEYRRAQRRFWHTLPPASRPLANSVRGGGVW